jgi:hypothetical protein
MVSVTREKYKKREGKVERILAEILADYAC